MACGANSIDIVALSKWMENNRDMQELIQGMVTKMMGQRPQQAAKVKCVSKEMYKSLLASLPSLLQLTSIYKYIEASTHACPLAQHLSTSLPEEIKLILTFVYETFVTDEYRKAQVTLESNTARNANMKFDLDTGYSMLWPLVQLYHLSRQEEHKTLRSGLADYVVKSNNQCQSERIHAVKLILDNETQIPLGILCERLFSLPIALKLCLGM